MDRNEKPEIVSDAGERNLEEEVVLLNDYLNIVLREKAVAVTCLPVDNFGRARRCIWYGDRGMKMHCAFPNAVALFVLGSGGGDPLWFIGDLLNNGDSSSITQTSLEGKFVLKMTRVTAYTNLRPAMQSKFHIGG
jgi:hypothetical protein